MISTRSAMTVSGDYNVGEMDLTLADECSNYYEDPLGWVNFAFDWGHGELEGFKGPDKWQRDILVSIGKECMARGFDGVAPVDPLRYAVASGHG